MRRIIWLITAACALTCVVNAQQAAKVDAVGLAKATLDRLAKGDYAAVVASFDDKVRAALPEQTLKATWASLQTQFGALKRTDVPQLTTKGAYQVVVTPVEFERAKLEFQIAVDASGRIAGLNVRPSTTANSAAFVDAAYVVPANFTERELTVDAGGWPLPGTLTVPNGTGPFPAVVLVHGSGPQDRDLTIGPNKPFRDLARGLASRGIAVLRYDKRTRAHGPKLAALPQFTVKEETIDDAVAAVRVLRNQPEVDPKRVAVLGHSLGGMLGPRIAAAAGGDLARLIIMAGAVRSLEQSLIDQTLYLAQADGSISAEEQKHVEELRQFAKQIGELKPRDKAPAMPGISAPTSYWIDLRGYDPPAAAKAVKVPMLIMQGGRDYQVTTDDFEKWRAALAGRKDVTLKLYPALNHVFIAGKGASVPGEYFTPGHVEEQVVRDIAEWIFGSQLSAGGYQLSAESPKRKGESRKLIAEFTSPQTTTATPCHASCEVLALR